MNIIFDTIVIKRTLENSTYVPINLNELQLWINNTNVLPNKTRATNNFANAQNLGNTPEFYRNSTKKTTHALNNDYKADNIASDSISSSGFMVHSGDNTTTGSNRAVSLYIPLVTDVHSTTRQSYNMQNISYVVLYNRNDGSSENRAQNLRIEFYNRQLDSTLNTLLAHTNTITTTDKSYRWAFYPDKYTKDNTVSGNSTTSVTGSGRKYNSSNITYILPPPPPTNVSAHPLSSNSVEISFIGSTGATNYTATSGDISGTSTESPITVTGLIAGESYTFTVVATNIIGDSSDSEVSITLPPSPPTNVSAQLKSNNSIDISFTESTTGADNYTATSGDISVTSTGSPITITGLTRGQSYTFIVAASDSNGDSGPNPEVSITLPPPSPPPPPTNISANPLSSTSINISFTESTGATEYTATSGDISGSSTASPITITDLTAGESYRFTVVATNLDGNSSPTPEVLITLPPSPPTNISANPLSSNSVIISFTESAGATNYTATSSPGDISGSSTGSPITITGLTSGESHTFTVVATNVGGESTASSVSSYITLPRNYITERNAVRFNVYNSTDDYYTAGNILPFDKIDFNIGGTYNTATYKYTFLKSGTYLIGLSYTRRGYEGSVHHRLLRNGIVSTIKNTKNPNGNTINSCYIYRFQVDDVIYHEVHQGGPAMNDTDVPDGDIYNSWWGIRFDYI